MKQRVALLILLLIAIPIKTTQAVSEPMPAQGPHTVTVFFEGLAGFVPDHIDPNKDGATAILATADPGSYEIDHRDKTCPIHKHVPKLWVIDGRNFDSYPINGFDVVIDHSGSTGATDERKGPEDLDHYPTTPAGASSYRWVMDLNRVAREPNLDQLEDDFYNARVTFSGGKLETASITRYPRKDPKIGLVHLRTFRSKQAIPIGATAEVVAWTIQVPHDQPLKLLRTDKGTPNNRGQLGNTIQVKNDITIVVSNRPDPEDFKCAEHNRVSPPKEFARGLHLATFQGLTAQTTDTKGRAYVFVDENEPRHDDPLPALHNKWQRVRGVIGNQTGGNVPNPLAVAPVICPIGGW